MCQKYEAIFIIKIDTNQEKQKEIINELNDIIESENCEIYYQEEKGMYNLAYEVKGEKKGYYYYVNFKKLDDKNLEEGKIAMKVNTIEEILKNIILKLEAS